MSRFAYGATSDSSISDIVYGNTNSYSFTGNSGITAVKLLNDGNRVLFSDSTGVFIVDLNTGSQTTQDGNLYSGTLSIISASAD
jgi:hypothetical protein